MQHFLPYNSVIMAIVLTYATPAVYSIIITLELDTFEC